jgi:hypothetical protein
MAYLCSLVMILIVTPGRIPKPCVVGSNPTGGAEYLPLSSRIPPVTRGHLNPRPDRPGRPPAAYAVDWPAGQQGGGPVIAPRQNAAARPANSSMEGGLLIARRIRYFRDPQMSRPSGAFQRRTTRPERADIPLCVCPMHLNYRAAGCANEFQTFGRKPPLKFLGVGACGLG